MQDPQNQPTKTPQNQPPKSSSYREAWSVHSGATEKQIEFIRALAEQQGISPRNASVVAQSGRVSSSRVGSHPSASWNSIRVQ